MLLTDDTAARLASKNIGITAHGTLGVLVRAIRQKTRSKADVLTVVLLVLVGLAGLMIPYISGFVSKTHDSTGTWNGAVLDTNIQRYQMETTGLPNKMGIYPLPISK